MGEDSPGFLRGSSGAQQLLPVPHPVTEGMFNSRPTTTSCPPCFTMGIPHKQERTTPDPSGIFLEISEASPVQTKEVRQILLRSLTRMLLAALSWWKLPDPSQPEHPLGQILVYKGTMPATPFNRPHLRSQLFLLGGATALLRRRRKHNASSSRRCPATGLTSPPGWGKGLKYE